MGMLNVTTLQTNTSSFCPNVTGQTKVGGKVPVMRGWRPQRNGEQSSGAPGRESSRNV